MEDSAKRKTGWEREEKIEARAIYNIYKGISVQQYRT